MLHFLDLQLSRAFIPWLLFGLTVFPTHAQVFQAEDYTYYHDTTRGNSGGAYRNDNVDIEPTNDEGGGYNVGWIARGEWLAWRGLHIATDGDYVITARVASPNGGLFKVDVDAGAQKLADFEVPATGAWDTWTTLSKTVRLEAGTYQLGMYARSSGWNLNWLAVEPKQGDGGDGLVRFEAEDFEAAVDTTAGNEGEAYRDGDVDIEACEDQGGGYNVGWTEAGERLTYPAFDIPQSGFYALRARVASRNHRGALAFELTGDQSVSLGQIVIPDTGSWQNWTTLEIKVFIEQGRYQLRGAVRSGSFNLNWIELTETDRADHYADPSRGEWTLLVVPDTQHYSQNRRNAPIQHMRNAFDWIVAAKDQLNLRFVQGLGDITEDWDQTWEWENAVSAWYKLFDVVPFMPIQGNHDSPDALNRYFPVSRFINEPWYGDDFGGIENNYALMNIHGDEFMFLHVESYDPYSPYRPQGLRWAQGVLADHPNHKVILATHDIWGTQTIREQLLTRYDNIVMTNAGHHCVREVQFTTRGPNGGLSQNFVCDYQCDAEEVMLLRYYVFRPLEDRVDFYTFSPITGRFEVDATSQGSFPLEQRDP